MTNHGGRFRRRFNPAGAIVWIAVAAVLLGWGWMLRQRPYAPPASASSDRGEILAPGVVHASVPLGAMSGMDIIDVDLSQSAYRPAILTRRIEKGAAPVGDALTPEEWLNAAHALAAVNGGYFGAGSDRRKEIVGALARGGKILRPSPPLYGQGGSRTRAGQFVRSVFAIDLRGDPQIEWAATPSRGGDAFYAYRTPENPAGGRRWRIKDAIGCGPTLIRNGRAAVSDSAERLASDELSARTFVAYDAPHGKPRHFVIGAGDRLTYRELASAILDYFAQAHDDRPSRAMCLDGGESSQISYVDRGRVVSPRATGVSVPDAVALVRRPAGRRAPPGTR